MSLSQTDDSTDPNQGSPSEADADILIHCSKGWFKAVARLDTGSDHNWISQTKVNQLGLERNPTPLVQGTGFNKATVISKGNVKRVWMFEGGQRTIESVFHVLDELPAPYEVIIGRSTLFLEGIFIKGHNLILVKGDPRLSKDDEKQIEENAAKANAEAKLLSESKKGTDAKDGRGKDVKKQ